jgi:biopolymer transport protein ExbD
MIRYDPQTRRAPGTIGFNAVPMIDVIFMLTIFFMLVSRFSSAEQIRMELPKPEVSQARTVKMPERVIINCRPGELTIDGQRTVLYSLGPNRPEPLSVISARLAAMKEESPNVKVIVRADRRLQYADVRAMMSVVAQNNIEMLNVVAHVGEGEQ